MKKFDLKTITPEEWKAWIYEYHPEPEKLKENEEKGFHIIQILKKIGYLSNSVDEKIQIMT